MGWLWPSSPSSKSTIEPPQKEQQASNLEKHSHAQNNASAPSTTHEPEIDADLDTFIKAFSAPELETAPVPEVANSAPSSAPRSSTNHERIKPDGSLNIHPDAIYPRTMSCRQAFDAAFYCQSVGGKFNDIYRFGHLQDCSEHWGAFWFCMRTRGSPEVEKQEKIRQYYETREQKKKLAYGSSEDIWQIRETPVERAFWKDPDADEDQTLVKE